MIPNCMIFFVIILIALSFWNQQRVTTNLLVNTDSPRVTQFIVGLETADLPQKFAEGGFHLYYQSPELKIRDMMAYRFGSGDIVKYHVDLSHRRVNLAKLEEALPNMSIFSNNYNVFNASRIFIFGTLDNGEGFYGEKQVDPTVDRDAASGHLNFDQINLSTNI